ncbi:hypothetical protein [Azospirillum sp. TSO22-1]|uniref:hypothetical protein n=1 Tax=Azospirillum sp. TSO22-1 TaxID=716789 RepID=UPI0011B39E6F|nr:hypothetical protein [Azospirillum sp. TSO22-1]
MPLKTISDVMRDVFDGSGFKCLVHEKRNLDEDPYSEYSESDQRIRGKLFESPENRTIRTVPTTGVDEKTPSILTYFMDGSRRVFRFSDIILTDGRYFPVLAGQVGVAVLKRCEDGSLSPMRQYVRYENILVLPNTIDGPDQQAMRDALSTSMKVQFQIADYEAGSSGGNASEDYINKGTKRILDLMHDLELGAVASMMANRDLRDDAMLVIDGSLQFRKEVLDRNKFPIGQLGNMVGVSKSFTPSQPVAGMKGGKHLGTILQELEFGQRTPVFKAGDDAYAKILGVWYLRIRPRQKMSSPLAGVVKVEVLANGSETDDGLNGDRVDHLSALILSERNVTPYGSDNRWANHLYPIHLTESYLKSGFLSDVYFKGLL